MIEFKGTSEKDWIDMQGHRVKDIIKRLNAYKKENKNTCPLFS